MVIVGFRRLHQAMGATPCPLVDRMPVEVHLLRDRHRASFKALPISKHSGTKHWGFSHHMARKVSIAAAVPDTGTTLRIAHHRRVGRPRQVRVGDEVLHPLHALGKVHLVDVLPTYDDAKIEVLC